MPTGMLASAAQPVIMDPVIMPDGVQHCDGGLTDANPARHLFDRMHGDHTVICLTPDKRVPEPSDPRYPKVLDQLERTLAIFVGNMYQINIAQFEALRLAAKFDVDVHWIEPSRRIKYDALQFKQPSMRRAVDRGWADVQKKYTTEESIEA